MEFVLQALCGLSFSCRERQWAKVVLSCPFQDLCISTLHSQEKYSSEFSIRIVTWDAVGGGMGVRKEEDRTEGRKRRRMEVDSSAGKEKIFLRKMHSVITPLRLSPVGAGVGILTQICCLLFCTPWFCKWTLAIQHLYVKDSQGFYINYFRHKYCKIVNQIFSNYYLKDRLFSNHIFDQPSNKKILNTKCYCSNFITHSQPYVENQN